MNLAQSELLYETHSRSNSKSLQLSSTLRSLNIFIKLKLPRCDAINKVSHLHLRT